MVILAQLVQELLVEMCIRDRRYPDPQRLSELPGYEQERERCV